MKRPYNDIRQDVGHLIRQRRQALCITLEELADALNVTPTTVQRWEVGERNVTVKTLEAIAVALDCTPADLVTGGPALTPAESKVFDWLRRASPEERRLIYATIEGLEGFASKGEDWEQDG